MTGKKNFFSAYTVESLEFAVAEFSRYSWVAIALEFTSSTKTNYKRFCLSTETEN